MRQHFICPLPPPRSTERPKCVQPLHHHGRAARRASEAIRPIPATLQLLNTLSHSSDNNQHKLYVLIFIAAPVNKDFVILIIDLHVPICHILIVGGIHLDYSEGYCCL